MNLLLSENLPLRMSSALGDFAVDVPLPVRYGDLTNAPFECIKLTATQWFAADHAMTITSVLVDDEVTQGWEQATETDDAGHTWTVINLAAAAPADAVVSACGTGKLGPTGALMENPADVAADILSIAGRPTVWSAFRTECATAGVRVAGSLDEMKSIREHLDAIARSVGAIWTQDGARLYPAAQTGAVVELDKHLAANVTVSASIDDTADILSLSYDESSAVGRPQRHLELAANPKLLGGVRAEMALPWLRSQAAAEQVGRRLLQRMAGQRYEVTFTTSNVALRPLMWVRLTTPEWPLPGAAPLVMVLSVDIDPHSRAAVVTGEHVAAAPAVSVTAYSVALPVTTDAGVDVAYANGTVTLKFVDNNGRPLGDARVSFDGGVAKRTDTKGQVYFTAAPGKHTVAVEATDTIPFQFEIVL